jgi:DNA mismatch endonuclease (patch repair protein)
MSDVHSKEVRSYNMSQIKGKDTKPEILVRKFLFANGFRYKLHDKNLPGRPDIILPKWKTIIFVNGCFWHGHVNCKYFVLPKTNTEFWVNKIESNKKRDTINSSKLRKEKWKIIRIYECQLRGLIREKTLSRVLNKILNID